MEQRVVGTERQHPNREEGERGESKDHDGPPRLPIEAANRSLIEGRLFQRGKPSKLQDFSDGVVIDERRRHGSEAKNDHDQDGVVNGAGVNNRGLLRQHGAWQEIPEVTSQMPPFADY